MEIKVLEENKDTGKVKIEFDDVTFASLLNEILWKGKVDYAAWNKPHPYLAKPFVVVKSKDPKKSLLDAAEKIQDEIESLKKAFARAAKD